MEEIRIVQVQVMQLFNLFDRSVVAKLSFRSTTVMLRTLTFETSNFTLNLGPWKSLYQSADTGSLANVKKAPACKSSMYKILTTYVKCMLHDVISQ